MSLKNWYSNQTDFVIEALRTSSCDGLSESEATKRFVEYGPNELVERGKPGPLRMFLRQFGDPMVLILIAAIIISAVTALLPGSTEQEGLIDAIVILAIVMFNAIFGFVQEYRSEEALEKLKQMAAPRARVLRDGLWIEVESRTLVPGDVIAFEVGDRIAADGRVIHAVGLSADESILTGESFAARKISEPIHLDEPSVGDMKNMVFQGTIVSSGKGRAVVTSTGMATQFGEIAELVQQGDEETTPLEKDLGDLGKKLGVLVVFLCIIVFSAEVIRNVSGSLMEELLAAIALAVSAIPEGLPAVVTVTLAVGVQRMVQRNAIVRRLPSVETLGSTTIIASDKTGTITKNEMTVQILYVNKKTVLVSGAGYNKAGAFTQDGTTLNPMSDSHIARLFEIGQLCSNAVLQKDATGRADWSVVGDPTEGAILVAAEKGGMPYADTWSRNKEITEISFDSSRKRMTSICKDATGKYAALTKGAPEMLLPLCTRIYEDNTVKDLKPDVRQAILQIGAEYAEKALRVLAFAYRAIDEPIHDWEPEQVERDLVFVGLMGMMDPPRDEVHEAIRLCKTAGIRPIMITGDHELTARAIAANVGLIDREERVLRGADLESMDDHELLRAVREVNVYARVAPQHKLRIVSALKRDHHVVAMTGDGVNDAPALRTADVGVSMGIRGADVTKEASDVILVDDNFATIVGAVEMGREIYSNIRKFVRFLLSANFDEIFLIFTMVMIGLPLPITPVLILWLNLATDGFPALALGVDPPEEGLMKRLPRNPGRKMMDRGMIMFVLCAGVVAFLSSSVVFLWALTEYGGSIPGVTSGSIDWSIDIAATGIPWAEVLTHARTMVFAAVVTFELLFVWNCRDEHHPVWRTHITNPRALVGSVLLSALLTLATVYVPFMQVLFGTVSLYPVDWAVILLTCVPGLLIPPHKILK